MAKLYTMFSSGTSLDQILKDLEENDNVSDVKVFGHAEEGYGNEIGLATAAAPISPTGMGVVLNDGGLIAEGLSEEIAGHFERNMENGARVVVLDTSDVDGTKAMLQDAGGIVSEGG